MLEVNNDNYFDIAEAIYCAACLWHSGQFSAGYSVLCQSKFKPGAAWSEQYVEQNNEYYSEIEKLAETDQWAVLEDLQEQCNEIARS